MCRPLSSTEGRLSPVWTAFGSIIKRSAFAYLPAINNAQKLIIAGFSILYSEWLFHFCARRQTRSQNIWGDTFPVPSGGILFIIYLLWKSYTWYKLWAKYSIIKSAAHKKNENWALSSRHMYIPLLVGQTAWAGRRRWMLLLLLLVRLGWRSTRDSMASWWPTSPAERTGCVPLCPPSCPYTYTTCSTPALGLHRQDDNDDGKYGTISAQWISFSPPDVLKTAQRAICSAAVSPSLVCPGCAAEGGLMFCPCFLFICFFYILTISVRPVISTSTRPTVANFQGW